jgi:hypothetical protein
MVEETIMNKAETIRRAMLKYPKATTAEIAQKCGCTLQNVYNVRSKVKMQNEAAGYPPLGQPQKLMLTASQVSLANKLGISIEDFARAYMKTRDFKLADKLHPLTKAWASRNPWFGADQARTEHALKVHAKLMKKKVNPTSASYFRRIDAAMQYYNVTNDTPTTVPLPFTPPTVGTELGGLTLTKKDNLYRWVKSKKPNMRTEMLKEVMPGLNSLFGTDYAGNPSEVKEDMVNHPPHYTVGGIETIDFIEAKGLNYHLGQVIKYVSRAGKKGDALQDLQKARWYLNREIARVE